MSQIKQINVYAGTGSQPLAKLAPLLESLFPVKFVFCTARTDKGAGELILGDGLKRVTGEDATNLPSLHVPQSEAPSSVGSKPVETAIRFADEAAVPFPFRGRSTRVKVYAPAKALPASSSKRILAQSDQGPVWTVSEQQGTKHFKSSFALPHLPPNGKLNDVLNGSSFLEMFFLIQWLRELCVTEFQPPALRASYIIDDPNLHWLRYGHVDYQQIAAHAGRENYHVSFATIPLDAWFTNARTANLFKKHERRISLSIHGNDHIKEELARDYTERGRISLLRQAIARMERLECRTGLQVSRVMVPPHGACSDEMLRAIGRNGFEAASISHGSLRAYNETRPWTKTLGYRSSEMIGGCPVMPRWNLAVDGNTVLLAAYLNQAIILRGHQDDLKEGIEILDRHAQFINSLGNVAWGNLTDLSRMNYQWRMERNICWLRPGSPKIFFTLPKGTAGLILDNSGNEAWGNWQITLTNGTKMAAQAGELISLPEESAGTLLAEAKVEPIDGAQNYARRSTAKAVVRRLLTEGRDRVMFWR